MPFHSTSTPEALVQRSDSRNATTTCHGITTSGRPCRRALATSRRGSKSSGTMALRSDEDETEGAALYCWQHKDQISQDVADGLTPLGPLKERTSYDTIADRLGVLSMQDGRSNETKRKKRRQGTIHQVPPRPAKASQRPGFWSSLCCMTGGADRDDYIEVVRHRKRAQQMVERPHPVNVDTVAPSRTYPAPVRIPSALHKSRPASAKLLDLIPSTLPPQTISLLLAEISKPISAADEEGYIYIFWLTDKANAAPSTQETSSLLSPPTPSRPSNTRQASDVLQRYGSVRGDQYDSKAATPKTVVLKIGRANNVHRRMNEWTRQCGYNLSLLRFYPYVPTTQQSPPSSPLQAPGSPASPRRLQSDRIGKVPYVHRVERLIHLELAGKQAKQKQCAVCGKDHKEWFEVDATKEGVRSVDEVVKRWVKWAEDTALKA